MFDNQWISAVVWQDSGLKYLNADMILVHLRNDSAVIALYWRVILKRQLMINTLPPHRVVQSL
jgi:hypothetical protein